MELAPFFAAYSGKTLRAIRDTLTPEVMAHIASLAAGPLPLGDMPSDTVSELVEMRVVARTGDVVRLDTALFTAQDLAMLRQSLEPLADRLAEIIIDLGAPLADDSPLLMLFLGGVIGFVQGSGRGLEAAQLGDDWRHTQGRYARSKVDFSEICEAERAFGPDLVNKSLRRGETTTRVTIGNLQGGTADDPDATPGLAITREMAQAHAATVEALRDSVASAYVEMHPEMAALVARTASGRQGAAPSRMMMHLFRYLRRLVAGRVASAGYFGDALATGTAVVCYENDIEPIASLLS